MKLNKLTLKSIADLRSHILSKTPSFYHSSMTSTVIPYDSIESYLSSIGIAEFTMVDLSTMPNFMEINERGELVISGAVTWKDAKAFCRSKGRDIMTSPTEELACILAGFATSATGERFFGFGGLREQVVSLEYCNAKAETCELQATKPIEDYTDLTEYQKSYEHFSEFKNAPFPRMVQETDLLIGTEGQLGVITGATLKTTELNERTYIFIKLPKWEESIKPHMEVFHKVQAFRDQVFSCELLDSNSLKVLPSEEQVSSSGDLIFLEVLTGSFEEVYEKLLGEFDFISEEDIFEISAARCHALRMNVPRYTFERNARMGVVKKGTDVQVKSANFEELFEIYRSWTKLGVEYNLFGHFGDAHLHFNFMPTKEQEEVCQEQLLQLYKKVLELGGSPFAEHGIGLIKQKFIKNYLSSTQYDFFKVLKQEMDPENIFFPVGYLNLKEKA
ncbi:hypothetical protein A9Q84_03790 [Halobacteriovorax marinus]|uniref:D-lactate dehydrogenase (cytochrome) n=1 Tax=Halobacteriovorax marinus TaxID=97084 RepID=A0A1Y5FGV6_9BACT|nr:hypothetical protein A9Q84_03790 [Halobacteriovorax marinus]